MKEMSIDLETYSDIDIKKCGAYKYAESDNFEILLFGVSVDNAPVEVYDLAAGDEIPTEILEALSDENVTKWAYNAAFERVCLEHVSQIKKALGISGVQTNVNSWKCEANPDKGLLGSQIDLLIIRKDQVINVCEMKYSESDYVPDLAFDKAMRRKIADLQQATKTKFAIHSTLVTTYDVEENSYYGNIQSIVTGEDLFR